MNLTGGNWRCRKDKDRRQTCKKLGSGVLGARMEAHSNLVTSFLLLFFYFASFLYSLKPYFFSLFFKAFLLFYSLKSQSLDSQTHNSSYCQQHLQQPAVSSAAANLEGSRPPYKQPINSCPPSASLLYTVANKEVEQQFLGGV
jgi:hypothetical protein